MKPPIASPFPDDKPVAPITKRLEWNEEQDCFVLRYASPFRGRLRCEIYTGLRHPMGFLGVTLFLPITVLLLLLGVSAQRFQKPNEFSVFSWGFKDASTEMTKEVRWDKVKRIILRNGDFFVPCRSLFPPGYYLCRENFADENEAARLQNLMQLLKDSEGRN
ncbi:MAG: hypothetical protein KY445_15995 [Armatimonadetes bacterium]|nr:hypothetical protein [Armatimonadota bacterium]